MSWSRRAFLTGPLALAACGFTPVYGPQGGGTALRNRVEVAAPNSRESFLLVQNLEEHLGRSGDPTYLLELRLALAETGLGIDESDNILRFNILGRVDYSLRAVGEGRIVTSGDVSGFTGYSASGTVVATRAAQRDAQARLMQILADRLFIRLQSTDLT